MQFNPQTAIQRLRTRRSEHKAQQIQTKLAAKRKQRGRALCLFSETLPPTQVTDLNAYSSLSQGIPGHV